jgi:hypothetical protein
MGAPDFKLRDFTPGYWRGRAEEERAWAASAPNPKIKKVLEQSAKAYEDMADLLEAQPMGSGK